MQHKLQQAGSANFSANAMPSGHAMPFTAMGSSHPQPQHSGHPHPLQSCNPGAAPPSFMRPPACSSVPLKRKSGKPERLPENATRILTHWYNDHVDRPNPSNTEAEALAKRGGINAEQVKKWFANKRFRSRNTKPKREQAALDNLLSENQHAATASRKHSLAVDAFTAQQPHCKKMRL